MLQLFLQIAVLPVGHPGCDPGDIAMQASCKQLLFARWWHLEKSQEPGSSLA
jgi:hypothetical protein